VRRRLFKLEKNNQKRQNAKESLLQIVVLRTSAHFALNIQDESLEF
jgi:hypothetical protein